jgi:hypothetical protein
MKCTDTVYIHWQKYLWQDEEKFKLKGYKDDTSPDCIFIREMEVEFEVPDDFDPVPKQIDMLKEAKQKLMADTQVKINNIDEQIQSLLAIEDKS